MASIQPIDSSSVHRIQSGQVIVDLCSVVKELVENSVDAGATSIEVRFKNSGLDAIEVSDNGSGISPDDYESVALKHYTSKLRNYDDLSNLDTFGFRGEALSSLCALSDVRVTTCREHEAPKGTKLEFEPSGKLRDQSMTAAGRGTTVTVENIFKNLPVRRQELTRNIKREYGKVLGLLQAYACISTKTKFAVSNVPAKGKKVIAFATKAGQTTRENIANVYSTKTTAALMALDLEFDMQPTSSILSSQRSKNVRIVGHVSRPTVGEGRQTPDRQMFFVNGRPCALPQVAKVMNDVYKGYNLSQSPFIFADIQLDTNAYDVNVSPDKRTIMLHEQTELLESLRQSLTELFDSQLQSVPQAKGTPVAGKSISYTVPGTPLSAKGISAVFRNTTGNARLPAFNPLTISKPEQDLASEDAAANTAASTIGHSEAQESEADGASVESSEDRRAPRLLSETAANARTPSVDTAGQSTLVQKLFTHKVQDRRNPPSKLVNAVVVPAPDPEPLDTTADEQKRMSNEEPLFVEDDLASSGVPFSEHSDGDSLRKTQADSTDPQNDTQILFAGARGSQSDPPMAGEQQEPFVEAIAATPKDKSAAEEPILSTRPSPMKATPGPVQTAFDRMRPFRTPAQTATITIGDQTTTTTIGSSTQRSWTFQQDTTKSKTRSKKLPKQSERPAFQSSLKAFAAPGSQMRQEVEDEVEESDDDVGTAPTPVPFKPSRPTRTSAPVPARVGSGNDSSTESDHDSLQSNEKKDNEMADATSEDDSDGEYLDEDTKKQKEDARVARLIQEAEERAARPTGDGTKRAGRLLKSGHRAATTRLLLTTDAETDQILSQARRAQLRAQENSNNVHTPTRQPNDDASTAEERLSLTVAKEDFANMRIAGQFNLGFIIALRPGTHASRPNEPSHSNNELFIIDQHASDEKYNFERLQATTIVQNQPLVHKQKLDLTAIEEEIIIENQDTLEKNGFEIQVDESGDSPVGQRCTLARLPMSKEVTFSTRDLEELIALLADSPAAPTQASGPSQGSMSLTAPSTQAPSFLTPVVRPSAVRKMFAMRACRSSVMIGKTLNHKLMKTLVKNMGEMEKPWNCPHGRPTMRHLYSFGQWEGWKEGDGMSGMADDEEFAEYGLGPEATVDWASWLGTSSSEEDDEEDGESSPESATQRRESDIDSLEGDCKEETNEVDATEIELADG